MPLSKPVYCVAVALKITEQVEQQIALNFVLSLNISPWKLFRWFRRPQLWATGDWQLHHNNAHAQASRVVQFLWNIKSPRWLSPLRPRLGTLWLLACPKIKSTLREEISDQWWDSGKYDEAADGNWENCVRGKVPTLKGDWGVIVLCTVLLVSCIFFNKCLCF